MKVIAAPSAHNASSAIAPASARLSLRPGLLIVPDTSASFAGRMRKPATDPAEQATQLMIVSTIPAPTPA